MPIKQTEIICACKNLPAAFSSFRVAHVSDLHNARFGKEQEKLLSVLTAMKPDIVAVTGDLIDKRRRGTENALLFLRGAVKIAPVYCVTGNHESASPEFPAFVRALEETGAHLLRNKGEEIYRGEQKITVIGLDDPKFPVPKIGTKAALPIVENRLKELSGEGFRLVLSHHPEYMPAYRASGAGLVLCGHAHGGQIRLPLVGGLYAPGQGVLPKYTAGLYWEENTAMLVSRGLGNSLFPIRVNNPPEVVCAVLTGG